MATTEPRVALDFRFEVEVDDPDLKHHLDTLFASLPAAHPEVGLHRYTIHRVPAAGEAWDVLSGGTHIDRYPTVAGAVGYVLWDLNTQAIRSARHDVVVHAGAVSRDGRGLLMPAPADSGKSTLVTTLVRSGWAYLTDEAAAIDPMTGIVRPYPKAIHLDHGTWRLFPDLSPPAEHRARRFVRGRWCVAPAQLDADISAPVPLALVVFPRYRSGVGLRMEQLSPAHGFTSLVANCFRSARHGRTGLQQLADRLAPARFWTLDFDAAESACRAIAELFHDLAPITRKDHLS